jgi:hypothetical protein
MTQEHTTTSKPQLKCRDCSVDIDKLLEEAEQASDASAGQAPPKPGVVFDLSLMGGGLVSQPEDAEGESDSAS